MGENTPVVVVAGPSVSKLLSPTTAASLKAPGEVKALAAAVEIGLHLPDNVRLIVGSTCQDVEAGFQPLDVPGSFDVQIQYFFLPLLRDENGKNWADSLFELFRTRLEQHGVRSIPRNFQARFVEHAAENPAVMTLILSFPAKNKDQVLLFVRALEEAHKQESNYALKYKAAREPALRGASTPERARSSEGLGFWARLFGRTKS